MNEKPKMGISLRWIWRKVVNLVQLHEDTDAAATIASISKSVEFKGVNIWILAFAIVVASVGLNVNSTAVIIGAMLISPLMGPINGIGLALGISDIDLLRKSLINLFIMVSISLLFSTAYFVISPLNDVQSELLARTQPNIYDVMIALFGGLAGIVAISRKDQPFTVISGVAIATALMPPLCTAGFGLATLQFNYFIGAFYLFFINSVCIAFATYFMVRYLRFEPVKFLDPKRKKWQVITIRIIMAIIIIPSVIMAYFMIKETRFQTDSTNYIGEIQKTELFQERQIIKTEKEYSLKKQTITLTVIGEPLSQKQIAYLQSSLTNKLQNATLIIRQPHGINNADFESEFVTSLLNKQERQILEKDSMIMVLHKQINDGGKLSSLSSQIAQEVAVQYPDIATIALTDLNITDTKSLTTLKTYSVVVSWRQPVSEELKKQLVDWLKVRLGVKELKLIEIK
ncbi:MAG: DUF389 domain-containing protein [Bacteroidales bacterium]|jgi:uncharacterized hydrophobic protein (TIGR00271 family)|nr:DUF389 domain-containing protein [Bacteroidales bacterium]